MERQMRYIIIAGTAIIGASYAGVVGLSIFEPPTWLLFVFIAIGGRIGIVLANWLLRIIAPKKVRRFPVGEWEREPTSVPFAERLHRFVTPNDAKRDPANARFVSKMPFWSLRDTFATTPPKSSAFIRRLLDRIHAVVSRATHR